MPEENKSDSNRQQGVFIPFAAAAIIAGLITFSITFGKEFIDRIATSERINDVQNERIASTLLTCTSENKRLDNEINRLAAELKAFQTPGQRFTSEDGARLQGQINKLSERIAVLEATRTKAQR